MEVHVPQTKKIDTVENKLINSMLQDLKFPIVADCIVLPDPFK